MKMYTCPDCKSPLEQLYCKECLYQYSQIDGIPVLLSRDRRFQSVPKIATFYDSLYQKQRNVWASQGRTREFIACFALLLEQFQSTRFLEIGCGEGFLLAAVRAREKFAVDLSMEALKIAQSKTKANLSVALAERLPFPGEYFDLVTGVGVMEHFLDDDDAIQEIRRVLRPGGRFVTLIHVNLTVWERIGLKISQYFFPRPKPVQFTRWLITKLHQLKHSLMERETPKKYVRQPIYNSYTTRSGRARHRANGFRVVDVLHTRKYPRLPLIGPQVVIYIARKESS